MTAIPEGAEPPELHRPVVVEDLGKGGRRLRLVAEPSERERLAQRLGLLCLNRLEADVQVTPEAKRHYFRLTATLEAELVQSCVVTLEPVVATVQTRLERRYSTEKAENADDAAVSDTIELAFDEADPPDPIADGIIDVGEAVVEQLALEIDPFPRAAGAEFPGYASRPEVEESRNPFAPLAKLKEGSSGKNR